MKNVQNSGLSKRNYFQRILGFFKANSKNSDELNALKQTINFLPGHVYWYDKSGIIHGCNDQQAKAFGLSKSEDLIGKNVYDMQATEAIANELKKINELVYETGQVQTVEEPAIYYGGKKLTYLSKKLPWKDSRGETIGIIGISFDITEEKKLKEELLLAKSNTDSTLKALLNNASGHIYVKDIDGKYLYCNEDQAKSLSLQVGEIIGKTDYDVSPKDKADKFREADLYVMKSGETITIEEPAVYKGQEKILLSKKTPLRNENDDVIGIIGVSIDITSQKEAERLKAEIANQEVERLNLENTVHKKMLQEQEKFKKIAFQVAHDITSPTIALTMFTEAYANELPEELRHFLKDSATRINDIAYNLLNQYKSQVTAVAVADEKQEELLLSSSLLKMLAEKKLQYAGLPIRFDFIAQKKDYFAFINIQPNAFKRSISNIVNNAVDAFDHEAGTVILKLDADEKFANLIIEDNGKGMPEEIKNKIMNNLEVTAGKADGHGIGMGQVRDTLVNNNGKMQIDSELGKGTRITLTFPRIDTPNWIADKIHIFPEDTLLILDDDDSIHGAWDKRFGVDAPNIPIKHFTHGQDVISYVSGLSAEQKEKLLLLTDYELLKQELNGLDVIERTGLKRSTLVTSHYENEEVRKLAAKTGTKILPKLLASEMPVVI